MLTPGAFFLASALTVSSDMRSSTPRMIAEARSVAEKGPQLLAAELLGQVRVVLGNDRAGERGLARDHRLDPLLERPLRDELQHLHAARLPDPVDAVGRLVLARLVPPAVVVDDHRG